MPEKTLKPEVFFALQINSINSMSVLLQKGNVQTHISKTVGVYNVSVN